MMKCSKCGYKFKSEKVTRCPNCIMTKQAGFQDIKDNINYALYVTKHKANIVSPMLQMDLPLGLALKHDLSKYSPAEFPRYRDWFVGPKGLHGTKDPALHKKWRKAVEHHYNSPNNLHHWAKKDPTHPENYPLTNRLESVADWYSVGKTNRPKGTDFPKFKDWYTARKDKLPVDIFAKKEIERRLGLTKAGSIMEKTALPKSPRLWGAVAGTVGGGMLGSKVQDKQGDGTLGTIGGAITGGILGTMAGRNVANFLKPVAKTTTKAAKSSTGAAKRVTTPVTKPVQQVQQPVQVAATPTKNSGLLKNTAKSIVSPFLQAGKNLVQGTQLAAENVVGKVKGMATNLSKSTGQGAQVVPSQIVQTFKTKKDAKLGVRAIGSGFDRVTNPKNLKTRIQDVRPTSQDVRKKIGFTV